MKKLRMIKLYLYFYFNRIKSIFIKPKKERSVGFIYEDED
jgi:hypothetical protein